MRGARTGENPSTDMYLALPVVVKSTNHLRFNK